MTERTLAAPRGSGGGKLVERMRLGFRLLDLFCRENAVSVDELQGRSQSKRLSDLRRRFARICRSNRVGRVIVARLLCRDQSTIAAYLSDKIVQDKVERKRRLRAARRNIVANSAQPVAQQTP